jgi:hypothetical protein
MLSDGLTSLQASGGAREEVEVLDVAQMLLASVKRAPEADVATHAEPQPGDVTVSTDTVVATRDVGPDAAASEQVDPEAESSHPDASAAEEPADADADPMPSADPAAETEPRDAARTDPDTRDHTESTEPEGDAAVRAQRSPAPESDAP